MTMKQISDWIYDHRATLMSWGATAGTVGSSILSARAVKKAQIRICDAAVHKMDKALEKAEENGASDLDLDQICASPEVELTRWERIKAGAPAFIPTILVEAATIGLIHGSNIANKQEINKARDALAVAVAGFAAYHESVGAITDRMTEVAAARRVVKMEADKQNGELPWDEKQLYRIRGYSDVFEATKDEIFAAEYEANWIFALRGRLTVNEFLRLFDLPKQTDEFDYIHDGDCMGWDDYIGEVYYGYHWIDFWHERSPLPDGRMVTEIDMPFAPHPLDEDVVDGEFRNKIDEENRIQEIMTAE